MAYDSSYAPIAPALVPAPLGVEDCNAIIPIARYRELTGDYTSTDARVIERLQYLERFCRIIIQTELDKYATTI